MTDIVDSRKVSVMRDVVTGQFFFSVRGQNHGDSDVYTCSFHHCSCPAFHKQVTQSKQSIYCKHQLAARIAISLNKLKIEELQQNQWKEMLNKQAKQMPVPFKQKNG